MPKKYEQLGSAHSYVKAAKAVSRKSAGDSPFRLRLVVLGLYCLFLAITARLFYWQILHRSTLQAEAEGQYSRTISLTAKRGRIYTQDGYLLVGNQPMFRVFAQPYVMKDDPEHIANVLTPILFEPDTSTESAQISLPEQQEIYRRSIVEKLQKKESRWVALKNRIPEQTKQTIEGLNLYGIGFDQYDIREYPEASLAAQITGFVGKDAEGQDQGYFGVEGAMDRELRGYAEKQTFFKDALGFNLLFGNTGQTNQFDGRDVVLSIRRDVQHMLEDTLKAGVEKYGAKSGEVIVMDPKTGKIIGMTSYPNYAQSEFFKYDHALYKNPALADVYEPGSTFKVLTVAAGIDAGVIKEDTICTECAEARKINQYTIKTWNDQYHPNITITDALAKSDNVAMIFVSEKLGQEKFVDYIHKFGIGEETRIELQEDTNTPLRKDWKPIDLATSSFGQGIATNGLQMVRAVGAIANKGQMMRPSIVEKVIDRAQGTTVSIDPVVERQVISPDSATVVTRMMVNAAATGEAKWTNSKTHTVAGKTGTAQVPIDGHYDPTKTVASFIGFSPAENPRFVMLVKLREPTVSPWAAETAAPLWYKIADKLYLLMNVPGDK